VLPTRKALGLLIYLVVEGGVHARATLADLLWPDSARPDQSRAALRYTLSCLRAALRHDDGSAHLIEGKLLGFDFETAEALDCDLRHFAALAGPADPDEPRQALAARLQQAATLWRGEFLEGFSVRDAPEFDAWITHQGEAWHRRLLAVLDRLSQAQADDGQLAEARETADRWVALGPLDERAHQRRIQLALAAGDRAGAQLAYAACRGILRRELGVVPAPETEALLQRPYPPPSAHPATDSAAPHRDRAATLPHVPLVGRAAELGQLVQAYQLAQGGRATAVVVQGEAGVGKTRLATEFLAWATAQGADVLAGRAFETGGRVPYQPLVDGLRPRLERENAPDDLLSDVWLAELARLLPELADRYPDLQVPAGDEAVARVRLFEAVARLGQALAACSDEAELLFVDDVQWADTATLDVLHHAARRWAELGVPVLLLLNVRTEALATDPALGEWLLGLGRDAPMTRISLDALGADDTEVLVRALGIGAEEDATLTQLLRAPGSSPAAEFARWVFAETGGQPFFVTETLKALLERGALVPRQREGGDWALDLQPGVLDEARRHAFLPQALRDLLRTRLARLSPAAGTLLTAAAVLAQGCAFELLASVAELGEQEALAALDETLHGSLLREANGRYQFVHDKIREVTYAEASDARRRVFHRRALEVLQPDAAPAELAHHALAAGLDEPAFDLSLVAGDAAMRVLAGWAAVEHYARAREIAERRAWTEHLVDLHMRFGRAYVSLAQWADAQREFEAALEAIAADHPAQRSEVLLELLGASWWAMDLPTVSRRAVELRTLGNDLDRADLQIAAVSWLAPTAAADGNLSRCLALGEQALASARALGVAPPTLAHAYLPIAYYWAGNIEEAVERSRESVIAARQANHASALLNALPNLGVSLAATGRYGEAARVFDEARRFGTEYGVGTLLARAIAMSAGYRLDLFDYAANEALADEARELARSLNWTPPLTSAGLDLILNFARRWEIGRAEQLLAEVGESTEVATAWHGWLWSLRLAEARAEVALARGDTEGALNWASRAIEQSWLRRRVKYEVLGLTTRGQALMIAGRRADAHGDLEHAVRLARQMGDPALFVRAASARLGVGPSETLALELSAAVDRIIASLPDARLRHCFEAAEAIHAVVSMVH
jgi:DNA-binding SARP family transcriptional activator